MNPDTTEQTTSLVWRRGRCSYGGCIEIADTGAGVVLHDSKSPDSPMLSFTREELRVFIDAAKQGEFDDLC